MKKESDMSDVFTITRRGPRQCLFCGEFADFTVADPKGEISQAIWDWQHNNSNKTAARLVELGLTAGQREILISGTHESCWDQAFADEEEGE